MKPIHLMGASLIGALAALAFQTGIATAQIDMKIGFVTINDPQHDLAKRFAAEVGKRSGGKIKGRVFPAAQLGKIPRQLEGLQLGTQEIFLSPPGFLVGMNSAVQVPDAPGVYDNHDHAFRTLTNPMFYDKFVSLISSKGIDMLNLWVYDGTSFASRKPITKLADFKGLKVRVLATKMESELVGKFGAAGVPMPYSEVLAALNRRTLDACRSSIVVMGNSKFFTVTKNITVIESGFIPSTVMVSRAWIGKLPRDLQEAVRGAGRDLNGWANSNAKAHRARAGKLWLDNGAKVHRLSAADQTAFMDRVKGLGDIYLGKHKNAQVREMYALLKKSAAATR